MKPILYTEATKRDVIDKFLNSNKGYWIRSEDGKIDWHKRMHPTPPWLYCKPSLGHNCHFYHKIMFDVFYEQSKIPIGCLNCWKVVVAPKSLRELIAMVLLQRQLFIPSKAGSEFERVNSPRMYGAYFYNTSYEDGHKCFADIKATLDRQKVYTGRLCEVPVEAAFEDDICERMVLKRGCTEYEQHLLPTPSDRWEELVHPGQVEYEEFIKSCFNMDVPNLTQSEHQLAHILAYWIHWAYRVGDETYKDYTDNADLFAVCQTFHDKPLDYMRTLKPKPKEGTQNGKEIK